MPKRNQIKPLQIYEELEFKECRSPILQKNQCYKLDSLNNEEMPFIFLAQSSASKSTIIENEQFTHCDVEEVNKNEKKKFNTQPNPRPIQYCENQHFIFDNTIQYKKIKKAQKKTLGQKLLNYNWIYNLPQIDIKHLTFDQKIRKIHQYAELFLKSMSALIGNQTQNLNVKNNFSEYKCQHCGKIFIKACALGGHVARAHKNSGLEIYPLVNQKRSRKAICLNENLLEIYKGKRDIKIEKNFRKKCLKKNNRQIKIQFNQDDCKHSEKIQKSSGSSSQIFVKVEQEQLEFQ